MAQLTAAFGDALAARGRLVMLVGEPGIGKTRTAEELAAVARQRGAEVMWGDCPVERGAPPFWPWAQVIRAHLEATAPDRLRSELGKGAGVIAEVVPEIAERLPGLEPPQKIEDPDSARFRLFDAVSSFLKRASAACPVVIVFDNLHWADGSSLRLLEFVAGEIGESPVLLLGTYRHTDVSADHPLFRALGELTRHKRFNRVALRGLEPAPTASLIESTGGAAPPPGLAAAVHTLTEGNPLFVRETARLLAAEGLLAPGRSADPKLLDFRLPEGVREVISRRLAVLPPECRELLTVAAVAGRSFSLGLLKRLQEGQTEDRLMGLLDHALAAHVIVESGNRPGQYEFSHALVQRTLAEGLSLTRRVRLHAGIAQALEAMYGSRVADHAAELAYHFAQAEAAAGPKKVVHYSLLAGEQALGAYAYEEAVQHFKRALAAKGEEPPDRGRAEALASLGRAQAGSLERTDMQVAVNSLAQAVDCYLAIGEHRRAVAVSAIPLASVPGSTDVASLLERVLPYLDDQSAVTPILLARYGEALSIERNDPEGAGKILARAEQVAKSLNDREAAMRVSAYRISVAIHHARFEGIVDRAVEVRQQARELGNTDVELSMASAAVGAQVTFGDGEGLKETMRVAWDLAPKLHRAQDIEHLCHQINVGHALFGDWEQVRTHADRGLRAAPEAPRQLGVRVFVGYAIGNSEEGGRWAERLLARMRAAPATANWAYVMTGLILPAAVCMGADGSLLAPARDANEAVLSDRLATKGRRNYAWRGLGMIAAAQTDSGLAARVYQPLLEAGYASPVTNRRVLGLVAKTMGRDDLARTHFDDNLLFCRKAGFRPELAWTCHDYANMLLSKSGALDAQEAARIRALLDEGEPIAGKFGMKPLSARLIALREKFASRRGGRPDYPDGLTEREVEVLRLVAAGKSNREIGEALVISENTVIRHVSNIFAKVSVANRAEAVGYAHRHGLAAVNDRP